MTKHISGFVPCYPYSLVGFRQVGFLCISQSSPAPCALMRRLTPYSVGCSNKKQKIKKFPPLSCH